MNRRRFFGAGWASTLGIGVALFCTDHALGLMLVIPAAFSLLMASLALIVIVCGSEKTCERIFRLLRLVLNRSEPNSPENNRETMLTQSSRAEQPDRTKSIHQTRSVDIYP
jgi:hypothetical protein